MIKKILLAINFIVLWATVYSQGPTTLPGANPEPVELNLLNIILFIVVPVLLIIVYIIYRQNKKNRKKENK
ncbi:hypothetical protein [Maribellus maritimus]|uniref:hypothetical protein n=1 Tax=Maribellus maritimus TaxID=2870838 RepID=UPI001EECD771|nr:hypothetical protein [Maribellus maritimus]MCG6186172.1 hypothetical protein [Maribellus maritimus]